MEQLKRQELDNTALSYLAALGIFSIASFAFSAAVHATAYACYSDSQEQYDRNRCHNYEQKVKQGFGNDIIMKQFDVVIHDNITYLYNMSGSNESYFTAEFDQDLNFRYTQIEKPDFLKVSTNNNTVQLSKS